MNNQLLRCGLILRLLHQDAGSTKLEMIRHLEENGQPRVSFRTLERDLDLLRQRFSAKIQYNYRTRSYVLESVHNHSFEHLSALIAFSAISEDLQAVMELMEKDGNRLLLRSPKHYESPKHLFSLARSIRKNFSLRVEYVFFSHTPPERLLIHPHLLVFEPGRWQLIAWVEQHELFFNLEVERIIQVDETSQSFQPQESDSLLALYRNPMEASSISSPVIRFRCSDTLYNRFLVVPPCRSLRLVGRDETGAPVCEIQPHSYEDAELLIQTFIHDIEILEPVSLKESVVNRLKNVLLSLR